MKQLGIMFLLVAAPASLMGQYPPPRTAGEAVSRFTIEAKARLIEKLDVAPLLSPSCKEVVKTMRIGSDRGVSVSNWGMDPSLARQIGDDELCRYVITRAQFHLELVAAVFSRLSLKDINEKSEAEVIQLAAAVLQNEVKQFWPGRDLSLTGGRGIMRLEDSSGRAVLPERLKTHEELVQFWNLWNEFRSLAMQQRNWNTPTLMENLSAVEKSCERPSYLSQSDVDDLAVLPGNRVYEACVLFLYILMENQGLQQPRVLYVFPID